MSKTKENVKTNSKVKRGAKGKYYSHVEPKLVLIEAWCRDGATDLEIYTKLEISKDSFYEYRKKYIKFADAVKRGKEVVDVEVENALLKKAKGYTIKLMKTFKVKTYKNFDGKLLQVEELIDREEEVHIPADTTAQIYWLNNRKPKDWRNKQEVTNTNLNTDVPYETFLKDIKDAISK